MKKSTLLLASAAMLFFASCKEEAEKTDEKTIIVEKEVKTIPSEEDKDGTSVKINGDGIDFSTKDGDNKTKVEIKK